MVDNTNMLIKKSNVMKLTSVNPLAHQAVKSTGISKLPEQSRRIPESTVLDRRGIIIPEPSRTFEKIHLCTLHDEVIRQKMNQL